MCHIFIQWHHLSQEFYQDNKKRKTYLNQKIKMSFMKYFSSSCVVLEGRMEYKFFPLKTDMSVMVSIWFELVRL